MFVPPCHHKPPAQAAPTQVDAEVVDAPRRWRAQHGDAAQAQHRPLSYVWLVRKHQVRQRAANRAGGILQQAAGCGHAVQAWSRGSTKHHRPAAFCKAPSSACLSTPTLLPA